ncbi:sugar transferase [Sphingomonas sp.]|uniref:sugar transferase n=1 Tax=Sphingomonas sp. TaxID=28214 RepID=UPI0025F80914|nr:sugar transferase [Sphingomonas sp.]
MTLGSEAVCEFSSADVLESDPEPSPTYYWTKIEWRLRDAWKGSATSTGTGVMIDTTLSRIVDVMGAATILLVALPFLMVLGLILYLDSPGPLFFVQRRVGRGGKMFSCLKFRTMCKDADVALQQHLAASSEAREEWQRDHKLRNDPRITRLGAITRKLSFDEFPQLINIIRGEMSLVGPRPIVSAEVERYGRHIDDYFRVRPGLTGLWQVSGRNHTSYRRRVSIDRFYVRNKSFLFDMAILMRTVPVVLSARGSY